MQTFRCVSCGKDGVPFPQGKLEPGSQWLLNCPNCGFTNQMGVGYPAQQGLPQSAGNQIGPGIMHQGLAQDQPAAAAWPSRRPYDI